MIVVIESMHIYGRPQGRKTGICPLEIKFKYQKFPENLQLAALILIKLI